MHLRVCSRVVEIALTTRALLHVPLWGEMFIHETVRQAVPTTHFIVLISHQVILGIVLLFIAKEIFRTKIFKKCRGILEVTLGMTSHTEERGLLLIKHRCLLLI